MRGVTTQSENVLTTTIFCSLLETNISFRHKAPYPCIDIAHFTFRA
jgi:hypothetical protein